MIDLDMLTEEQRWGLQFAVKQANEHAMQNDLETTNDLEYLTNVIREVCDSYYEQLLSYKEQLTINTFYKLSPQQQGMILQQLGVQDILGGK